MYKINVWYLLYLVPTYTFSNYIVYCLPNITMYNTYTKFCSVVKYYYTLNF